MRLPLPEVALGQIRKSAAVPEHPVFPLEPTFRGLHRSVIERHHGSQRNFAEVSLGNSEHTANLGVMATVRSGGTAMPRYYFDIREGLRFRPDRAGAEFEDLGSAKSHAVHLAGEIAEAMPLDPSNHGVIVEVCNEHKERVLTVTISLWIERAQGEDQPVNPWGA